MTIKELIDALKELPEDAQVFVSDIDGELIANPILRSVWYSKPDTYYLWSYQQPVFSEEGKPIPEEDLARGFLLEEHQD